jgi:hypothetical protein
MRYHHAWIFAQIIAMDIGLAVPGQSFLRLSGLNLLLVPPLALVRHNVLLRYRS